MLKENHSASDVQDLLAEYNLLKEVDHQHVIRLLGACTDRRGPIYLIMEFAKHGSLKNFLYGSRKEQRHLRSHSESSLKTHSKSVFPTKDEQHVVAEQDIIEFALQIARGMKYLSDVKVFLDTYYSNHC